MKKILFVILTILTIFTLTSCKKNEVVGRITKDFLSDFTLNSENEYDIYESIVKDQCSDNRLGNKHKGASLISFSFKPNKKISIKTISFRIYNYSETDSFNIFVLDTNYYQMFDKENCGINYLCDEVSYHIETIKPNEYYDVTLNYNDLQLKKNTNVELYYGVNFNAGIQGIDINEPNSMTDLISRIRYSTGICNFNVEYTAYMKI